MASFIISHKLKEYCEEFLNYLEHNKGYAKNTIGSYTHDLYAFFSFCTKHYGEEITENHLKDITHQDIRSYLAELQMDGLIASTVARKLSVIRTFYNWLEKYYDIKNEKVQIIKLPKIGESIPKAVSDNDIK
ncbi:MAG: site-specific integrase, partial [Alphaproteobacteria bacterium]